MRVSRSHTPARYFNPRAPRGARRHQAVCRTVQIQISIHAPREGRDREAPYQKGVKIAFQSTRPARGATRAKGGAPLWSTNFNPRAPRGARRRAAAFRSPLRHFNPRAPRGARPTLPKQRRSAKKNFNPRAPRGARPGRGCIDAAFVCDFNPRAPRGARPQCFLQIQLLPHISIHAPREGRDESLRGLGKSADISIHAPREGRDRGGKTSR